MKEFRTIFLIVSLLLTSGYVISQTNTWDGSSGTSWGTPANWSLGHVPLAGEHVVISSIPANQPLLSGATGVCNNLTINSGATLTISATSAANALLTASGNAAINGSLSIAGTILKTAKLAVVNITWASGSSMAGYLNGSMEVSGNWEFSAGSAISMGYTGVVFTGSSSADIISKSSSSSFAAVTISKTTGNTVSISNTSTATLKFNGTVTINTGSTLIGAGNMTTVFYNSLINTGHFFFSAGTVSLEQASGTQVIQVNTDDFFNNLTISAGGTVTISNYLQLLNNLTIQSGIFDPLSNTIILFGNWSNTVGPDAFTEGTGTVVFNGGNYHQYCSNESFYKLTLNKSLGGAFRVNGTTVSCYQYDWTAGAIDVLNGGTFTANDLLDDGIFGDYYCNSGCTINVSNNGGNIDLRGNLYIYGGTFNVYGGNNPSWWPYMSNSSITMSGGVLNFADQGILVRTDPTYTFTDNITGGTIKTSRDFTNGRADFTPAAGTIELYGSINSSLTIAAGSLFNFTVNKAIASTVTLATNATVNGALTIQSGTFQATSKILFTAGNISINNGGTLWLENSTTLRITGSKALTVASGGMLKAIGLPGSKPVITNNAASGYHEFHVNGTISARYAIFEYNNGINIWSTGIIDPANPLDQCTFQYGVDRFLFIGNSQEVTIRDANFPTVPIANNVWKNNNAGRITFRDATGAYAGSAYENDPYNRIDWIVTQPGLWTGEISSDWFTAQNWDDYTVPTATTNVTIPSGTAFSPVIGSGIAYCNDIEIQDGGVLNQNSGSSLYISGDLNQNFYAGKFLMAGASYLYFSGASEQNWSDYTHDDTYTNVRISKDINSSLASVHLYDKIICSGTFEIREGYLNAYDTIIASNTGSSSFEVEEGGTLESYTGIITKGNIHFFTGSTTHIFGTLKCAKDFIADAGSEISFYKELVMNGSGTQYINNFTGEVLALTDLAISKSSGVCYINNDLVIRDLLITGGALSCNNGPSPTATFDIVVERDWENEVGPSGFEESTGRVIFSGSQYIGNCNSEVFNIFELDKNDLFYIDGNVACAAYDWTEGTMRVKTGSSFSAVDLLDNAITGSFICLDGGTINLTNSGTGTAVDLSGEIHNFGGTINISGSISNWPYNTNAVIEMTGGVIDVKTCGITINNTATYSLHDNITGGTIRTSYGFTGNRADFNPAGGTVELYGPANVNLEVIAGSLWGLTIDKTSGNTVSLDASITINGGLTVENGAFYVFNKIITLGGDLNINDGGTFELGANSQLKVANEKMLQVNNGGLLKTHGAPSDQALITHVSGYYFFQVTPGGTISSKYSTFQYSHGIIVATGAFIDPANAFYHCTFTNFTMANYLFINNAQDVSIHEASFPTAPPVNTVVKTLDQGHIYLKDATGAYAGPAYEYDPYNRIDWSASTPGLWTGEVSSDWYATQNWDDYTVPTAATNVTIPSGTAYAPVIGSGVAHCDMITVQSGAELTIGAGDLNVAGNLRVHGQVIQTSASADVVVAGSVFWESGSTANITASGYFHVAGNWEFRDGSNVNMANGTVSFTGSTNAYIRSYEAHSAFSNVYNEKTAGALYLSPGSTDTLKISGAFSNRFVTSVFYASSGFPLVLQGQLFNSGHIYCENGTFILKGTTNIINLNTGDYFNNIIFNSNGIISLADSLRVNGNLTISSGTLAAGSHPILVKGNWMNNAGTDGFIEATGRVIFNGASAAGILSLETFYNLDLDKTYGNYDGLQINQHVDVTNDLHIIDGIMALGSSAVLEVTGNLTIDQFAGLNAVNNARVLIGKNWSNANTYNSMICGFYPETYSTVTFNGVSDQLVTTNCSQENFGYLSIDKPSGRFRPNSGIRADGNVHIDNGVWEDNVVGLTHSFCSNFDVATSGAMYNAIPLNTIEFKSYGTRVINYSGTSGGVHNIVIDKDNYGGIMLYNDLRCRYGGSLTVDNGVLYPSGTILWVEDNITVNDGGQLMLPASSLLVLTDGKSLNVNPGGRLDILGTLVNNAVIRADVPAARYGLYIHPGGTIAAEYCNFKNMSYSGVNVGPGSTVDPAHSFTGCTFQDGVAGGKLLTLNNEQTLTVRNAMFPGNTWGGDGNVAKTFNTGQVYFVDYSGGFSGQTFESDDFNRIEWVPEFTITPAAAPASICSGTSTQLNANYTGGLSPYACQWSPAAGLSDPAIPNPVASPLATTTYYVTVTDGLGTIAIGSVLVSVNPVLPVSISITATANPSPPGNLVTFAAVPVNGGSTPSFQWKVNGVSVGPGFSSYSYVPNYNDQVMCTLTSAYACPSGNPAQSDAITMIVVETNTNVTGTVSPGGQSCVDASNTITVAGGGNTFLIESGGRSTMIAGIKIRYLEGTTIQPGGYLHGLITTTNDYCGSMPPSLVSADASGTVGEEEINQTGMQPWTKFSLYPNPTAGRFALKQTRGSENATILVEIFNMCGEKLHADILFREQKHGFDLSGRPAGLYVVKVTQEDHVQTFKVILAR